MQLRSYSPHRDDFTWKPNARTCALKNVAGVLRAFFGYRFLVLVVRIAGRRPGKQLTPFEFVIIFFIGGLTLTYMVGDDRSITNAICQITAVAMAHKILLFFRQRFPAFGRIVDGTPIVLLKRGEWMKDSMRKMGMQDDDVMAAARDKEVATLQHIGYAILERNGEIAIVQKQEDS